MHEVPSGEHAEPGWMSLWEGGHDGLLVVGHSPLLGGLTVQPDPVQLAIVLQVQRGSPPYSQTTPLAEHELPAAGTLAGQSGPGLESASGPESPESTAGPPSLMTSVMPPHAKQAEPTSKKRSR